MSLPACKGLILPLVSIPLPMTACPSPGSMGSRVTAGNGGGLQAGDSGAVLLLGGGSSLLHFMFQKMSQTHFFGERKRDLGLGCVRCREALRPAALLIPSARGALRGE